jgi:anti-sigma factor RsiW
MVDMATTAGRHVGEETIEKYSMGQLAGKAAARVEEHLLICGPCRQSLAASDAHVAAMRTAAARLRREGRKAKSKSTRKAGGNGPV